VCGLAIDDDVVGFTRINVVHLPDRGISLLRKRTTRQDASQDETDASQHGAREQQSAQPPAMVKPPPERFKPQSSKRGKVRISARRSYGAPPRSACRQPAVRVFPRQGGKRHINAALNQKLPGLRQLALTSSVLSSTCEEGRLVPFVLLSFLRHSSTSGWPPRQIYVVHFRIGASSCCANATPGKTPTVKRARGRFEPLYSKRESGPITAVHNHVRAGNTALRRAGGS